MSSEKNGKNVSQEDQDGVRRREAEGRGHKNKSVTQEDEEVNEAKSLPTVFLSCRDFCSNEVKTKTKKV